MKVHEFVCRDCGVHVTSYAESPKPDGRCLVCHFIAELPTDDERSALRAMLYDAESMRHWRRFGCYRDDSFPERDCDLCGARYRGPAVYCCLDCASADAGTAA